MNRKLMIVSLLVTSAVSAPLFALKSIADVFKNPKIENLSPEMKNKAFRAQALENLTAEVETPYNVLHAQYGDATTLSCEETMSTLLLKFFRSALTSAIKDSDNAALTHAYNSLYNHLKSNANIETTMVSQFIALIIARRITIAGLEFSIEQAGKSMTPQQQVNCATLIQKINDLTLEFLVQTVGLPLETEEEAQA